MKEILTIYYIEAKTTTQKPIAWITSGAPVEFLIALDVLPIYPENYAAMCAANHQSVALMEAAEAEGFSQDICAYARTDFGPDLTQGGPVGGLPAPHFLLCSTNICKTVIKWYEVVARKYQVPLFIVDTPFLHDGLTRELIDYTVSQFKDLEKFLGEITGPPVRPGPVHRGARPESRRHRLLEKDALSGKDPPGTDQQPGFLHPSGPHRHPARHPGMCRLLQAAPRGGKPPRGTENRLHSRRTIASSGTTCRSGLR